MKKAILLVSNNRERLQYDAETLTNANEYTLILTHSAEEAIEKFQQTTINAMVVYNDINSIDGNKLSRIVRFQSDHTYMLKLNENSVLTKVLDGLLRDLDNAAKPSYTIKDDALKYAAYDIKVEQPF